MLIDTNSPNRLELITKFDIESAPPTNRFTIPNLDGDRDIEYFIEAHLISNKATSILIKPNSTTYPNSASYVSWELWTGTSSTSHQTGYRYEDLRLLRGVGLDGGTTRVRMSAKLTAITDEFKMGLSRCVVHNNTAKGIVDSAMMWNDRVTKINSLQIASTENFTEGWIELYRKRV